MYQIALDLEGSNTILSVTIEESSFKKLKEMGVIDDMGYMKQEDFMRLVEYAYSSKRIE